jgi:hypothetical protein
MAEKTPYLKLEYTTPGDTDWFSSYRNNMVKLDAIGKHLRTQTAAGKSMAIRTELYNGTLAEAIRIVPDLAEAKLTIYLGRPGKGDKVIIESSSLFSSLNLSNQNPLAADKVCSIGVNYFDEDGNLGDPAQDTTILIDNRNNRKTTIVLPPASNNVVTAPNPYLGSPVQLGTDPLGTGVGTPHMKLICETSTGTREFIIPAYSL